MSWTSIVIEVVLFASLGAGYYFYQKRKIIKHTKMDIRERVYRLITETETSLNPDSIDEELANGKYLEVIEKIKHLSASDNIDQLLKDLEEINKYA